MTDAIGGTSYLSGLQGSGLPSPSEFRQTILSSAAQALGMSTQDVQTALQGGQSLADLAQKNGISSDQLVSAVAQGIQSLSTNGSGGLPGAPDATQMAQRIVDRKGGIGGHHHRGGFGAASLLGAADSDGDADGSSGSSGSSSPFSIVASALGMSQDSLLSALESGTSLTDLLGQQGLTPQSLNGLLGQGTTLDTTA